MMGPIINLISGTHHLCERREYAFMVLREYTIIFRYYEVVIWNIRLRASVGTFNDYYYFFFYGVSSLSCFILKFSVCVFFSYYILSYVFNFFPCRKNALECYKLLGRKDYWHGWFLCIIMLTTIVIQNAIFHLFQKILFHIFFMTGFSCISQPL